MDAKKILQAVQFAAQRHGSQKRKSKEELPYILHPIEVANILVETGKVEDDVIVMAALLHDTLEDTNTEPWEIEERFGKEVLSVVLEVTDDKSLPKEERKRLQVENAPRKSLRAKQVKIADKISNVHSVVYDPPVHWSLERRIEYAEWSNNVIKGLIPCNSDLENAFRHLYEKGMEELSSLRSCNP